MRRIYEILHYSSLVSGLALVPPGSSVIHKHKELHATISSSFIKASAPSELMYHCCLSLQPELSLSCGVHLQFSVFFLMCAFLNCTATLVISGLSVILCQI